MQDPSQHFVSHLSTVYCRNNIVYVSLSTLSVIYLIELIIYTFIHIILSLLVYFIDQRRVETKSTCMSYIVKPFTYLMWEIKVKTCLKKCMQDGYIVSNRRHSVYDFYPFMVLRIPSPITVTISFSRGKQFSKYYWYRICHHHLCCFAYEDLTKCHLWWISRTFID